MNFKVLSIFIILSGLILLALGGFNWVVVENKAKRLEEEVKQANEYREAMKQAWKEAEHERVYSMPVNNIEQAIKRAEAVAQLLEKEAAGIQELSTENTITVIPERNQTLSYSLIAAGILVLIIGIGVRVSSKMPKIEDTSE